MGRQPNWYRDLVAKVIAEREVEEARNRPPPPKPTRITTQHAREYQRMWTGGYPYPPEFYELTCGARTRAGTPCKLRSLYSNGRCKFHCGLSTGPKTEQR